MTPCELELLWALLTTAGTGCAHIQTQLEVVCEVPCTIVWHLREVLWSVRIQQALTGFVFGNLCDVLCVRHFCVRHCVRPFV